MNGRWRGLLSVIALQLLLLPLRAAEAPPAGEQPAPPATSPPATEPAPSAPGETPPRSATPASPAEDEGTNERVSVDNNLTFPVDI